MSGAAVRFFLYVNNYPGPISFCRKYVALIMLCNPALQIVGHSDIDPSILLAL